MNSQLKIYLVLLSITISNLTISQNLEKGKVKFIHNLTKSKYVVWPENELDTFRIAIVKDVEMFDAISEFFERKSSQLEIPVTVTFVKSPYDALSANILYLHQTKRLDINKILKKVKKKPTLIVGENFDFHTCMINILTINDDISFEMNMNLIKNQDLKVQPALDNLRTKSKDEWSNLVEMAKTEISEKRKELNAREKELKDAMKVLQQQKGELTNKEEELLETSDQLGETTYSLYKAQNEVDLQAQLLELQKKEIEAEKRTNRFIVIMLVLALLLIIAILIGYRIKRKTNERLGKLNKAIISQKNQIISQKLQLEQSNNEVLDSINYASNIQNAILPSQNLIKKLLPNSFILYKPKNIVSGDFYWLQETPQGILIAAADCTGHGVPGALMSMICSRLLYSTVKEHQFHNPAKILDKVNADLREVLVKEADIEMSDGMDIALCHISKDKSSISYAGAYNPLYLIRDNTLKEVKADSQPIGKYIKNKPFTTKSLKLHKGDVIYIFSDGYQDQFGGERGKKYKSINLKKFLLTICNKPMKEQKQLLAKEFDDWKGGLEQIDDVCFIGIQV